MPAWVILLLSGRAETVSQGGTAKQHSAAADTMAAKTAETLTCCAANRCPIGGSCRSYSDK